MLDQIKQTLETKTRAKVEIENQNLIVPKENWFEVARFLQTNETFDYLSSATGVDYKEHFEVVYHLYSIEKKIGPVAIKVRTDRQNPSIPSVTGIWRSAEFQEREIYDLFGIHFENHPDLRRILMWDGFKHYPLRKDYVIEDQDRTKENF